MFAADLETYFNAGRISIRPVFKSHHIFNGHDIKEFYK